MFTGLITDIGTIVEATQRGDLRLAVACAYPPESIAPGESIALNGCCLTVVEINDAHLAFTLSAETLERTAPRWQVGERVNLERALRVGDSLGGHFVSGHVDGLATLISIEPSGDSRILTLDAPPALARFIAEKGSVTLDGVSLTVNAAEGTRFTVNIIPHTLAHTTLSDRRAGDALNLEIDLIARYLVRQEEWARQKEHA